ncbi:hypothetical protein IEQ34_009990 [Dendrobium chrysotoxum]|uniref:Uncharacterized protein n=1 Tax=Dendrobium chrysotoxum TaxID=161865 RepID=A0AAV7H2F9_DENCH|nr:hypothetical protein IEQ34_009990 [Dendrobium chrysotoxum]
MDCPRFTDHLEAFNCFYAKNSGPSSSKSGLITSKLVIEFAQLESEKLSSPYTFFVVIEMTVIGTSLQGTFVVQDNMFRWIARISPNPLQENSTESSTPNDDNQAAQTTSMHLYFPCGIIRGALTSLGIPCAISADISNRPASYVQGVAKQPNHLIPNQSGKGKWKAKRLSKSSTRRATKKTGKGSHKEPEQAAKGTETCSQGNRNRKPRGKEPDTGKGASSICNGLVELPSEGIHLSIGIGTSESSG